MPAAPLHDATVPPLPAPGLKAGSAALRAPAHRVPHAGLQAECGCPFAHARHARRLCGRTVSG